MNKIKLILLALSVCAGSYASPIFYWYSDFGDDIYTESGALVAQNSDWLVQLIDTSNATVLWSVNDGFAFGAGEFDPNLSLDASNWNGITVMTVIYNAPTVDASTSFAEFRNQRLLTWDDTAVPPPRDIPDYLAGGVAQTDWQAIPEPAVAGLISIFGLGLIGVRRIFFK